MEWSFIGVRRSCSRRNNETDGSRLLQVCMQLSEDQVFSAASGSSEHINIHCDGRNLMAQFIIYCTLCADMTFDIHTSYDPAFVFL